MNLTIDILNEPDKTVAVLSGEVDVYTAPQLKEALLDLVKHDNAMVVVDMADVGYMDSTGLSVFISALKAGKEHDSHLKLINLQDSVTRLFDITGLDKVIDINASIRGGS
ncbi:Anti-sigma-B factor antagonist [Lentibacillus sp. JNUCC-1]|uniref:STAS domain-containing protein n=1 Tax=Lentibacillus sp. JNUCC-1 TaxID=2654513 RepID=UPI0012E8B976|nr:STAS domain-containing protein [Lentibacillus sp. JNUCC-1]MUV38507.1 Anti-sigma-B factor antagonist [Lentibacillus sp. JNUCC-1]